MKIKKILRKSIEYVMRIIITCVSYKQSRCLQHHVESSLKIKKNAHFIWNYCMNVKLTTLNLKNLLGVLGYEDLFVLSLALHVPLLILANL